jgi:hypothetical protein
MRARFLGRCRHAELDEKLSSTRPRSTGDFSSDQNQFALSTRKFTVASAPL